MWRAVKDHFDVHRWDRAEPRLAVVALPAAGDDVEVHSRITAYQQRVTLPRLVLIPPEELRLSVAMIGWARDINDTAYQDIVSEIGEQLAQQAYQPLTLGLAHLGRTSVSLHLEDVFPVLDWAAVVSSSTRTVLGTPAETFGWPHFGIAYALSGIDRSRLVPRVVRANGDSTLGTSTARWQVTRLAVTELRQDAARHRYHWTVRDELPVGACG